MKLQHSAGCWEKSIGLALATKFVGIAWREEKHILEREVKSCGCCRTVDHLNDILMECYRGKFGTVYRCREKSTGLALAAKFVGIAWREEKHILEREVKSCGCCRSVDHLSDILMECYRGKFGTVYRCREKSTGLALAAKFVGIAWREEKHILEREVKSCGCCRSVDHLNDILMECYRGKFGTVYRCREKSTGLALAAKFVGIAWREEKHILEREVKSCGCCRSVDHLSDILMECYRGKFGTVYRCREKSTGLALAAKFVGIARREDRRNVEREVEIMRMLQHPRIIQLYDAYESSNVMCVIQELIEGGELFDRVIGDDFILTEKSCTVFVRQICEGVAFIHSKNVLHLDLKPENILCLTRTGNRIKIIDFGLARQYDPSKKLQVLFGTPEFVAPEVVNFDAIGFGTDMWSVGVICYVLLSGLSPFMGETDVETMANVTVAQYDFDDEAFDDISEEAKDFIKKLLVKTRDGRYSASECLCHPWLSRRPPLLTSGLDVTKENLRETLERWSEQDPSPTQVMVVPLLPTPPVTPVITEPPAIPIITEPPAIPIITEPPAVPIITEPPAIPIITEPPAIPIITEPPPTPPADTVTPLDNTAATDNSPKGIKNPGDLQSPNPSKQPKFEMTPVKSKDIKDTPPEETKVSTFAWTKKTPTVKSQMGLPEEKSLCNTKKEEDSKNVSDSKFPSKFSLKPSSSISNAGNFFNSRVQQGGTAITISKKALNPSPQPKIAGIVLGQTHPRGPDLFSPKKELPKPTTVKAPPEPKPKIITHKIIVEGKDITEEPSANITKAHSKTSPPINIDNKDPIHPLLRNLQSDRFERRCSDISCFLHDIENSTDGASILGEIKRLSTRLFESDLLDESNNNRSSSLLRQIANRGIAPRRPKFRVTNLNRDVPIGSPPPPTNMTYFIPPNSLSPESYSSQTHSAPQSPRGSPDRMPETLTKDVILRLFDKLEGHSEHSAVESVSNYVRSSETKKKVTSISSK